jgi:hypothetical protein
MHFPISLFPAILVTVAIGLYTTNRVEAAEPVPLPGAHAHNDYEHARPLFDALDHGFCSIESDIYLIEGELLVAHDRKDVKAGRTLEALYLDPLRARIQANGGRVFRDGPTVTLLVDVKSEARATYAALETVLARYADILTRFESGREITGAVTVIVSGNRTYEDVVARERRHSALDGRSTELHSLLPATVYPWISENWNKVSKWRGEGTLPAEDEATLRDWVRRAHAGGRKIRFWNTPESVTAWRILQASGVDLIGTDNLAQLRDFLQTPAAGVSPQK